MLKQWRRIIMEKWGRNFKAVFQIGRDDENGEFIVDEVVTIEYPYTLRLSTDSGINMSANTGVFQLYNLSETLRHKLWLDPWEYGKKR